MPANLTPDYLAAEAKFRAAESTEEKLEALDEMYATIPKHKGTEKLRADIKRRISKLREKEKQSSKTGKHVDLYHIERQDAGQVVLLGPPNSGKSSILAQLTSAEPEIDDYPITTREPMPGMMEFDDISIQLIDTPAISHEHFERGLTSLVRNADIVVVVLDCSNYELLDHFEDIRVELSNSRTVLVGEYAPEVDYPAGTVARRALVVANKTDLPGAVENLDVLRECYGNEFAIHPVSVETGEGIDDLRRVIFDALEIIRVYTKVPGKPPDMSRPFTLKKGSTLLDFAAIVHKDFVHNLRYARVWGKNVLEGAQIGRDHVLEDGDVVELHA
ncbi:MAG: GTPase [Armatimonadota bacterium]|nr:TGS domain-containing protein [bacterium]